MELGLVDKKLALAVAQQSAVVQSNLRQI